MSHRIKEGLSGRRRRGDNKNGMTEKRKKVAHKEGSKKKKGEFKFSVKTTSSMDTRMQRARHKRNICVHANPPLPAASPLIHLLWLTGLI